MAWATTNDANTLTGIACAEDELLYAQAMIELFIGRTESLATAELSARDLEWLRRAVVYQAVWLKTNPDAVQRIEVSELSQDGVSGTLTGDALVLAPLARRAINKLSWKGSRSVCVAPLDYRGRRIYWPGDPIIDYNFESWRPL